MSDQVWAVKIPRARKAKPALPSPPPPRVVLGWDPGSEGAAVALSLVSEGARFWRVRPKRLQKFPVVDFAPIRQAMASPPVCFVEHVQGRGGWSAQSNFGFGAITGAGISLMRSYGWEVRLVKPRVWQDRVLESLGVLAIDGTPKEKMLAVYRALFPANPLPLNQAGEPENNTIDALLIAYYGVLVLGAEPQGWDFKKGAK